jgi:NAD(P)-dependent dehydrogenase (short-subunit alcohol dehydrogenase family)
MSSQLSTSDLGHVVVTGASSGIGTAVARELSNKGYRVTGTYLTGHESAVEIRRELKLEMVQCDLSSAESVSTFLRRFEGQKLRGLVNNAGAIDFTRWSDFDISEWKRVFAVNVSAPLEMIHSLRGNFSAGASIVNIASTDGYTGSFASIAYSASKAALINVTKSLGNVLGPEGVRVNAVAPGWIDTGMSTDASYAAAQYTPLGRNGRPQDVADVVTFLIGDESKYVNGATWVVDGGYTNVDVIMKREADELESE